MGVLSYEMETATLFVLCSLFILKAGTVHAVYAHRITNEVKPYTERARKKAKKKERLFPSML
jgi:uridine phosphorylase